MSDTRRPAFDEVLEEARRGSPPALGALYRQFQPGVLRLLNVIAPHHAEDIASDVWLEVVASLSRFTGDERCFRGWLATTARRRVIDAHRRAGRQPVRSSEPESLDRRPGRGATEEETVDHLASVEAISRVVSVLSPDQAHVVLMRVVGGLEVHEVAKALGKQPGAVRSLQHRALRRLARHDPKALLA